MINRNPPRAAPRPAPAVELRHVTAGYGRRAAIHAVTATPPRRGVTAVVGPNGSGKSTLLAVMAGTITPMSGTVRRAGGGHPAFVPQRSAVSDRLPITVREAVAMGRWAHLGCWRRPSRGDREIVEECLARLGIAELAERRLDELSGGQRQRTLVAQGIAQEADLLLLDEPTTGLDLRVQPRILAALRAASAEGTAVVHVTHDLETALRADHCLLMRDGRLAAEGPPRAVLTPEVVVDAWRVPHLPPEPTR